MCLTLAEIPPQSKLTLRPLPVNRFVNKCSLAFTACLEPNVVKLLSSVISIMFATSLTHKANKLERLAKVKPSAYYKHSQIKDIT